MGMKVLYNKKMRRMYLMTKVSALSRKLYLAMLALMGVLATWFAMMSTSSCTVLFLHQPKMPLSLIKKD